MNDSNLSVIESYRPSNDQLRRLGLNNLLTEHAVDSATLLDLVLIRHEGGWVTAYAHADQILVKRGDTVTRGQVIAKAGATGSVDQPQVHFELRQGSKPIDPAPHMEK